MRNATFCDSICGRKVPLPHGLRVRVIRTRWTAPDDIEKPLLEVSRPHFDVCDYFNSATRIYVKPIHLALDALTFCKFV